MGFHDHIKIYVKGVIINLGKEDYINCHSTDGCEGCVADGDDALCEKLCIGCYDGEYVWKKLCDHKQSELDKAVMEVWGKLDDIRQEIALKGL